MTVLNKTKELCEAIVQSDEFQELKRAETILVNDLDAQDLIKRFNYLQANLENLFRQGKKAMPQEFSELRALEEDLNKDPSAGPYFKAQQKFTDILAQVNSMINDSIKFRTITGAGSCSCGKHNL